MNRRSFLKNSALALFGFTVLPPAETYQRIWKAQKKITGYVFNPADYQGEWSIVPDAHVPDMMSRRFIFKAESGLFELPLPLDYYPLTPSPAWTKA